MCVTSSLVFQEAVAAEYRPLSALGETELMSCDQFADAFIVLNPEVLAYPGLSLNL